MLKNIKNEIRHLICKHNYAKVLKRIKKYSSDKKIKVIFYVAENSKWGYQSLYEILNQDNRFEVLVLVGVLESVHKGKDITRNNLEENYEFFKNKGINVDYAYRNGQYVDLKKFKPDILFYEQPWGLPKLYKPLEVSKYTLTFMSPYSFQIFDYKDDYKLNFHKCLYRYLVTSDINIARFESYSRGNSDNCMNVNYIKLDDYFNNEITNCSYWKDDSKIKIIYAPHHSFIGMNMATFKENGLFILEWAKSHPETTWIFKPHPNLKFALIEHNIMTIEEVEKYYKEWETVGNIYTQGYYFDIFKTSDLMITDCCSFLGEYFLTQKPIIRPIKKGSTPLNKLGQKIVKGYYETCNNEELSEVLFKLLYKENDYKKNIREVFAKEQSCFQGQGCIKVYEFILSLIEKSK